MKVFSLGKRGCIKVKNSETVCNVIAASEEVIKEIASKARKVISKKSCQIEAIIDEVVYGELCQKHGLGNGFSL